MSGLVNRLAALGADDAAPSAEDAVVAADLRRLRGAARARRHRRTLLGTACALVVITLGSLTYAVSSETQPRTTSTARSDVELVAYSGGQLPGYAITTVPAGYVLQGISGSVLDVAQAGDRTSLDVFVGKLVVMLNDHPGPTTGTAVTVSGHAGYLNNEDGVQILTYSDGTHDVEVQAWNTIHITPAQLVRFAEGITVLAGAQVGHG